MYSIKTDHKLMPRERLIRLGPEKLSNQELLAILLRTGNKEKHVLELSAYLLSSLDSLADLKKFSLQELQRLSGIGKVKAIEIKAMLELADRIQIAGQAVAAPVLSSAQVAEKMMIELGDKQQEHLVAIYLDSQNKIIEEKTIFIGTVRKSIAEPREILYYACKNMATSLIVVHNHPSGLTKPSANDYHFTEKIKRSCDYIGLICLDHIIVSKHGYYSFREKSDLF
ncbi:TPA: DNA repair protein RadC [Streptococcus equi subsp. zooepidemicus]|uniref:RadC family protein n=1 Tax=Streptococcus equi TaxID=1336 RepID=UPI0013F5C936|nr:DNA repair protein RadC [Streptococcus equi]MCD3388631.1 DNA repair protein RadC [Streptococcus equi subsp. zooepidemicus]MCD3467867.1 DNA repair protein RadC [Streptococcus equi subsp. zooepidemicus]HEK9981968.1 DNA repair protein RadC [Streptococcus equi subsp. zooepidemicus]HEL0196323.1 DNA repair protein RadC [Streptococcus equi subsp. zooepidemicus]HEL0206384.1 DNA repair protein RadC [Streptococcus equi subsp. zooepidemicus]